MNTNRTVVDLNKVQYADFFYRNQYGMIRYSKPLHTAYGSPLSDDIYAPEVNGWPRESMLARAKRRKLLDVWTPQLVLVLQANKSLTYTGKKAQSIYKEWCAKIFKKKANYSSSSRKQS
jgi:hypothetical protein